jgi:hypothetical protein
MGKEERKEKSIRTAWKDLFLRSAASNTMSLKKRQAQNVICK